MVVRVSKSRSRESSLTTPHTHAGVASGLCFQGSVMRIFLGHPTMGSCRVGPCHRGPVTRIFLGHPKHAALWSQQGQTPPGAAGRSGFFAGQHHHMPVEVLGARVDRFITEPHPASVLNQRSCGEPMLRLACACMQNCGPEHTPPRITCTITTGTTRCRALPA